MNFNELFTVDYSNQQIALMNDARNLRFDTSCEHYQDIATLIFVRRGEMRIAIDDAFHRVSAMQVLIARPGRVLRNPTFSDDFDGQAVFLTVRFSQHLLMVVGNVWQSLLSIDGKPIFDLPYEIRSTLRAYHELLLIEIANTANQFYHEVVTGLLRCMLSSLISAVRSTLGARHPGLGLAAAGEGESKHMHVIFSKFIDMLTSPQQTQRKLDYYARQLCITPKYLSAVCKRVSGRTAHQWISETISNNIYLCLRYTGMSIKEISFKFGFSNLGFFSRYVKENLGKTPSELRREQPRETNANQHLSAYER